MIDILADIGTTVIDQLRKPTLSFLLGGMVLAALGSRLEVPQSVYKFIVMLLLLKVGLGAGISVREADLLALAVPALCAAVAGIAIVLLGGQTLARWRGVSKMDGMATAGLFGAVSASTLAAGMVVLDSEGIAYEGFIGALYPFMDIAALVTAIVLARMSAQKAAAREITETGGGTLAMGGAPGQGPSLVWSGRSLSTLSAAPPSRRCFSGCSLASWPSPTASMTASTIRSSGGSCRS